MDDFDYSQSLETIAPGLPDEVAKNQNPGEPWYESLARLLPILATTYQQRQLLSVQVERARQGLAPLDVSAYAAGVNVGISPEVKQLLIIGGLAIAGLVALSMVTRGRR
jgi:hypothetical protein